MDWRRSNLFSRQCLIVKELENNLVFQQAVLESTANGIVVCDKAGTFSYFNETSCDIFGLPMEHIPFEEWAKHYSMYEMDGKTPLKLDDIPLVKLFEVK